MSALIASAVVSGLALAYTVSSNEQAKRIAGQQANKQKSLAAQADQDMRDQKEASQVEARRAITQSRRRSAFVAGGGAGAGMFNGPPAAPTMLGTAPSTALDPAAPQNQNTLLGS